MEKSALIVVDMQRYYFDETAPFCSYYMEKYPGSMDYIGGRVKNTVIPNIIKLLSHFRSHGLDVIFLRLCGTKADRSDLHKTFRTANQEAEMAGVKDLYPLASDPMASMPDEIAPMKGEIVINKTTFSAFTSTDIDRILKEKRIARLVFTGLATSQCVDTTARDAADRGYSVIHVEDAQADYNEQSHVAALVSSVGVCGGACVSTGDFMEWHQK